MKRKILIMATLLFFVTVCYAAIADISGKWSATITTPDGNQLEIKYVFKVTGNDLTGTGQGDGDPEQIKEGKIDGNDISFTIYGQNGDVYPHKGKYYPDGDTISMNFDVRGTKIHATLKRMVDK